MPDITDLSKAVMREGSWFIVPAEHVGDVVSAGRESIIVHQCERWSEELRNPAGFPYQPLGYWTTANTVNVACKLCKVPPPEAIAKLWLLHNFDTFAGDPSDLSRAITKSISRAFTQIEHRYFIKDRSCKCRACYEPIGTWE